MSVGAATSELGLRERKKARLRRQIAEVALDLYRERGHDGTTVDEICRQAEISQPTFYKYYPSKEAILTEHATRGWGELLRRTLQEPGSLRARLQRFVAGIAAQMTRDRKLWHAIAVSNAYNPVRDPSLLGALEAGRRSRTARSRARSRMPSARSGWPRCSRASCCAWASSGERAFPKTTRSRTRWPKRSNSSCAARELDAAPPCTAMPVVYQIDLQRRLIRTTCRGAIVLAEALDYFDQLERDVSRAGRLDVLFDFRETTTVPKVAELRAVAERIGRVRALSFGACAIVTDSDVMFGMSRMFEVFTEKHFAAMRVFRDHVEAEVWLHSMREAPERDH
jgi:AcrR family transcriptional regulator